MKNEGMRPMELRHFINRHLGEPPDRRPEWWHRFVPALEAGTKGALNSINEALEAIATDPVSAARFIELSYDWREKVLLLVAGGFYGRVFTKE